MDGLSCVPAIRASTQGWTSERVITVERWGCLELPVVRVNVEPRSHRGLGLLSRRLAFFRTSQQVMLMPPCFFVLHSFLLKEVRHETNRPDPLLSLLVEVPHAPLQRVRLPRQLDSESTSLPSRRYGGFAVWAACNRAPLAPL